MGTDIVLRWIGRLWGVASTLVLLAFIFGGAEHLRFTTTEAIAFLFFPIGVVAGYVLAWWRDLVGGLFTVASLAAFYLLMVAQTGQWPSSPYFLLFAVPGVLHITSAVIAGYRRIGFSHAS